MDNQYEERSEFWILKLPSVYEPARDLARVTRVGEREVGFYSKILPDIKVIILEIDLDYLDPPKQ